MSANPRTPIKHIFSNSSFGDSNEKFLSTSESTSIVFPVTVQPSVVNSAPRSTSGFGPNPGGSVVLLGGLGGLDGLGSVFSGSLLHPE